MCRSDLLADGPLPDGPPTPGLLVPPYAIISKGLIVSWNLLCDIRLYWIMREENFPD